MAIVPTILGVHSSKSCKTQNFHRFVSQIKLNGSSFHQVHHTWVIVVTQGTFLIDCVQAFCSYYLLLHYTFSMNRINTVLEFMKRKKHPISQYFHILNVPHWIECYQYCQQRLYHFVQNLLLLIWFRERTNQKFVHLAETKKIKRTVFHSLHELKKNMST